MGMNWVQSGTDKERIKDQDNLESGECVQGEDGHSKDNRSGYDTGSQGCACCHLKNAPLATVRVEEGVTKHL